mmetsp:Transcript_43583/g.111420  ORF Transcript_43583/g.111420 Transcript_43583/m.111420 type:complete len:120 (-) Transcript_43583:234-593(-)|eukprot:jgi/Tetstr1/447468/TSEL_003725.t1
MDRTGSEQFRGIEHTKGTPRTQEHPAHGRGKPSVAEIVQQQSSETTAGDLSARQQPVQRAAKVAEARKQERVSQTPTHSAHEKVMSQPNRQVRKSPGQKQPAHHALNHTKLHSVEKQTM